MPMLFPAAGTPAPGKDAADRSGASGLLTGDEHDWEDADGQAGDSRPVEQAVLATGAVTAVSGAAGGFGPNAGSGPEKQTDPQSGVALESDPMWETEPDEPETGDDPAAGWDEGGAEFIAALLRPSGVGDVIAAQPELPGERPDVRRPVAPRIISTTAQMPVDSTVAGCAAGDVDDELDDEDEDDEAGGPDDQRSEAKPFSIADLLIQDDDMWSGSTGGTVRRR